MNVFPARAGVILGEAQCPPLMMVFSPHARG